VREIYSCSSNAGKMAEFLLVAKELGLARFRIGPLPGLAGIAPPEETGTTFEQNAELKACYYSGFTNEMVLADDSGLEVAALDGAPGVYSARFAGEEANDQQNNHLVVARMQGITDRRARFVCVIAVAQAGKVLHTVRGMVDGELLSEFRGSGGFGYDPLFFYPPLGCAFGELRREEKLAVSHRGSALRQVVRLLEEEASR
jgi:XTP/dITP diphosphohydrolase